jgi:hypothetical protein
MGVDSGYPADRIEAATFRLHPSSEVSARQVTVDDLPVVLIDVMEPGHIPLRFAMPESLARRMLAAVSDSLPELVATGTGRARSETATQHAVRVECHGDDCA